MGAPGLLALHPSDFSPTQGKRAESLCPLSCPPSQQSDSVGRELGRYVKSLGFPSHPTACLSPCAGAERRESIFQGEWGWGGAGDGTDKREALLSAPDRRHSALWEIRYFLEISLLIVFVFHIKAT